MRRVKSFGQTLYDLTARRAQHGDLTGKPRPDGRLIWVHLCTDAPRQTALVLVQRLIADLGTHVLLTAAEDLALPAFEGVILCPAIPEHSQDVRAFLEYWALDLVIFAGGEVRPAVVEEAQRRQMPVMLVDAVEPKLGRGSDRWFPGLMRRAVSAVDIVFAVDEASARAYRKFGAPLVQRLGRMEGGSEALTYHEPERATLAQQLATRPVWLAADVSEGEEAAVVAAHRAALRLAHRLLLILVPENPTRAAEIAAQLEAQEGWITARRELDEDPDPEVSVYIIEGSAEYGLWYRLAPVTFMGGSLLGGGSSRSPIEPAALGSAIIHGRRTGAFGADFGRLGAALASAAVSSPAELAQSLSDLLAPDRAARLAHAAWGVVSEGAEVTDRVVATARALMERAA